MLTTAEVARHLSVDPATVRRLVDAGDLAAVKVGRVWRVRPADLTRYIAENTRTSSSLATA